MALCRPDRCCCSTTSCAAASRSPWLPCSCARPVPARFIRSSCTRLSERLLTIAAPRPEEVTVTFVERLDRYQRTHRRAGFPIAVLYKFIDDQGTYLAAIITYYGIVS